MPWAATDFTDHCQRCNDCIDACDESILVRADGGYPGVDFRRGGCTFCGDCIQACTHGALDGALSPPWQLTAHIDGQCLEVRGITCRICGDACETRAIRFRLRVGGRAELQLHLEDCTGCGACVARCPVNAVSIRDTQTRMEKGA